jgi:putative tryptophan/tyrosine transport system substrate-binding protein
LNLQRPFGLFVSAFKNPFPGNGDRGSSLSQTANLLDDRQHDCPGVFIKTRETRTIPIVFAVVSDPIGSGFGARLAHPGGNITGFTTNEPAVGGKWLGLLKEVAPRTVRVALLFNPATAVALQFFNSSVQDAATFLAVQASAAPFRAKDEIEDVIAAQARIPGGGLVVLPDAFYFHAPNRDLIIALAARYGVPTIYFSRLFVKEGGLISYSANFAEGGPPGGGIH